MMFWSAVIWDLYVKSEPYLELPLLFQSPGGLNSCFLEKESIQETELCNGWIQSHELVIRM